MASPLVRKYSCRRRRLQNCSLSWQILTGSANFGVGQKADLTAGTPLYFPTPTVIASLAATLSPIELSSPTLQ